MSNWARATGREFDGRMKRVDVIWLSNVDLGVRCYLLIMHTNRLFFNQILYLNNIFIKKTDLDKTTKLKIFQLYQFTSQL